ncbi:Glycerophosphoryl diester phosphodiesterase precursor [Limnohabitans sp. 63ED37-2]|nr:Glycerophosphoryl diester phosphodiesterase precursor [Limnohabitans sp. 63ED37-2]
MRSQNRLLTALLGTALLCLSLVATAQKTIDLQGHRGARGLLAENTLPSFALALQMGVTTLELDVVVTQDDVLVISHDPTLNPDITRDAQGRFLSNKGPDIRQLTFEQLQSYDVGRINPASRYAQTFSAQKGQDGVRIPRLKDLFELVKAQGHSQVKFAIETKITPQRPDQTPDPERFVQLLLQEIREHGMSERVQILSFDWRTLQVVQKLAPGIPTVYVTAQLPALDNLGIKSGQPSAWTAGFQHAQHGSVPHMIKAAGGSHWSSFWRELDAQKVREAQSLGIKVLAWTVNDRQSMGQMLDLGVDGLVTDRPDIAADLLKERGIRH